MTNDEIVGLVSDYLKIGPSLDMEQRKRVLKAVVIHTRTYGIIDEIAEVINSELTTVERALLINRIK